MKVFALVIALLSAAVVWINKNEVPLPFPAHHHKFQDYDASVLPTNPAPLEGVYAPNEVLRKAHRLFDGVIQASEHVAVSPDGNLTLVDKYGYVFEAKPDAQELTPLAYVGPGRPLGFHHDAEGNIIIADALKGLLKLHRGSLQLEVLANRVSPDAEVDPGHPLTLVDALDIAADGTIYFSAANDIPVPLSMEKEPYFDALRSFMLGFFSGSMTGRLLKYDPATRRTEVLMSGLWFANGVALSADESFVTVVETTRIRVHRYWLKGPKAGTHDILIERLPGAPDGIARASDGNFWIALVAPTGILPKLLTYKPARVLIAYLTAWVKAPVQRWGAVLKVSPEGKPLQFLMDPDGSNVALISAVTEHAGRLYFGNVKLDYISYLDMRDLPPLQPSS